jgi:hypothetical protein
LILNSFFVLVFLGITSALPNIKGGKMGGNGFKERPITKEETDMKFKALDLALAIAIFLVLAGVLFNGVVGP